MLQHSLAERSTVWRFARVSQTGDASRLVDAHGDSALASFSKADSDAPRYRRDD